ncbi:MAG: 23S rRNA (guanosine(2251)-2'-O)-methyltransferase RlmB [Chitinophagaceae bacterium]|nr:MAG: 23S rRNA (guanosine(2251)-2'-O)-methyltransferase RlmB [Chitinophagaceae bacterium]
MKNFRKQTRPKKSQLVFGWNSVIKALSDGVSLDKIYIDTTANNQFAATVRKQAAEIGVPINYVPKAKLDGYNIEGHEGIIALKSKVKYYNLQDVISNVVESGEAPLFLILDGITDIRNIGGIARTAWCCGVHAIIIPEKGVGALNEDAILTSAGALELITVCRVNSIMKAIDDLHLNGFQVLATEMKAAKTLNSCDFTIPTAIVMGSEEKGIYPAVAKICDANIAIPMKNDFESLNVSVATGMILYEAMTQRLK